MFTLTAEPRTQTGKAAKGLLSEGRLPVVLYGPSQDAVALSVSLPEFVKILRDAGESSVLELSGVGAGAMQVLIHEVDRNPVTNQPRHADLYAIKKGAKVTVSVPLSFVGESAAVKAGASLVKVMHELEVEASPAQLPHEIEVDIAGLAALGDQIRVADVTLPKGVEAMIDAEEVVALVQENTEESEDAGAAPDMDAIAVEQKGKGETEEEAA